MTTAAGPRPGLSEPDPEPEDAGLSSVPGRRLGRRRRPASGNGCTRWIWGMAAGLFVLYTVVSVRLHQRLLSGGVDLGIFEQSVRSYAHGHWPVAVIKGPDFNLLGDHFSPAVALLAPFYRVFPSPVTILVAQAALLAVAVVPLAAWAQRAVGRSAAVVVGLGYGLSWGIAQTVGFDFHEIAFAVPLLAFSAAALGEGRYTAAVLWALPLLAVKEDQGATVAVLGALLFWKGQRGLGLATAAVGIAGSLLAVLVILPANNPAGFYYWSKFHGGSVEEGEKESLARLLERATVGMISPEPKAILLVLLLAPTAMLALRSPLILLAVPTLVWRLFSENPAYWGVDYHYSAVLMPVIFAAFVDVLRRRAVEGPRRLREPLVAAAVVTALLIPSFPLWSAVRPSTWKSDPRIAVAHEVLGRIPDGATVAASNRLAPHLTGRAEVTILGTPEARQDPQWVVVDMRDPVNWPFPSLRSQQKLVDSAVEAGYVEDTDLEGYLLLRRP